MRKDGAGDLENLAGVFTGLPHSPAHHLNLLSMTIMQAYLKRGGLEIRWFRMNKIQVRDCNRQGRNSGWIPVKWSKRVP